MSYAKNLVTQLILLQCAIKRHSLSSYNNFGLLELVGISLFHKSSIHNNRPSKALGELCKIHIHNTTGKRWLTFLRFYWNRTQGK